MEIRHYESEDERDWVRCRTLAFLDTAYYDNVLRKKEKYDHPAIELVAVENGQVAGLLDIEYEVEERTVCSRGTGPGGMLWHIAVHPDYHRQGVGSQLLIAAESIAKDKGLNRLEAWTRDDSFGLYPVQTFAHYVGTDQEAVKERFKRVHECICYEKPLLV